MVKTVDRLRDLVIDRVAFVPTGDDPAARILIWKAKDKGPRESFRQRVARGRQTEPKGGTVKTEPGWAREIVAANDAARETRELVAKAEGSSRREAERLFDQEARRQFPDLPIEQAVAAFLQTERGRAMYAAVRAAPPDAVARPAGTTGSVRTVSKAEAVAGRLRQLVKDRQRASPTETDELALVAVLKTREGRAAYREQSEHGTDEAFRKVFYLDAPEVETPSPTRGEQTLEQMASAYARDHELTKEQAMVEVVKTEDGAAAYGEHRREVAART